MNTTVNSNSQYKDWMIMDCYSGSDVGGAVAFGVNRQSLGAYIMRSAAARGTWEQSAELIGTHNYTSYTVTKTGSGASGTWGISISGTATNATNVNIADDTSSKLFVLGATATGNTRIYRESSVYMQNNVLMGAAWNDYAEYRMAETKEPGRVVCETPSGKWYSRRGACNLLVKLFLTLLVLPSVRPRKAVHQSPQRVEFLPILLNQEENLNWATLCALDQMEQLVV